MSRISTQAAHSALLRRIFETQQSVHDRQIQATSEKKSQNYLGIARESRRLINIENTRSTLERFVSNNEQVDVRLEITEKVVEQFRTTVSNFRQDVNKYASGEKTDAARVRFIQTRAYESLKHIQSLLNTDIDGRYLFSGSKTGTEPVDLGITTIEAFQAKYDGTRIKYPETSSAHLESFTINSDTNNLNKPFITPTNFLKFTQDSDGDTTTAGTSTIEASSAMFSNVSAGTYITVASTTNNNGTYTVDSVSSDGRTITVRTEMLTDETNSPDVVITYPNPANPKVNLSLSDAEFGTMTFSRSGNTLTGATANGLSNIPVGSTFTVTNSSKNNGTYTVSANTGTAITIESKKLTDEGTTSSNSAAATFFDYVSDTHVKFNANGTIQVVKNDSSTAVPGVFNGLAVGNQLAITGTGTGNDQTVTINAISADGSTITVSQTVTAQTDTDGVTFTGANSVAFAYSSHTKLIFTDNGTGDVDTIQVQTNPAGAAVADVFDNLSVGQSFTVTAGTNAGTYTIGAKSADGSTLTLTGATLTNETNVTGAEIEVYSVAGNVSATSYFRGDQRTLNHRVDDDRTLDFDIFAAHPAFEKGIRGISMILQGKFGTEGGLDQNQDRSSQAEYLLEASLERTVAGTAPFGTETVGSLEQMQIDLGFDRVLINDTNKLHEDLIGFFKTEIIDMENIDMTETLTNLLDEQRALEASFQIFARVRELSLTNFI